MTTIMFLIKTIINIRYIIKHKVNLTEHNWKYFINTSALEDFNTSCDKKYEIVNFFKSISKIDLLLLNSEL